jgi:AcrR family transcriptional regulator
MELPASVEAAWGLRERPHRGPKPGLSLARIVEAGVAVAGSDGLAAVSMGRVAAELGAAPMSLYRYVGAKDELIALMADAVYGEFLEPAVPGEDWRAGLTRCAWTMRAALYRHPWALKVPISGLPVLPNEVAWFEQALGCLDGTGLTEPEKASVIQLVAGFVRNEATTSADITAAIEASGDGPAGWLAGYGRLLGQLTDAERYPAITRFISSGVYDELDPPDQHFGFGLKTILDGIAGLIAARSAGPAGAASDRPGPLS